MIQQFTQYLQSECKIDSEQKVLVALSGGADSVVLLHLFKESGIQVQAAHCNFNLRAVESDEDEAFVQELCEKWEIPLFVKHFDTVGYSEEKGISIEMAARELRYNWFRELLEKERLDYIATGHHKDDNIETFFLNLARGTGIKGLSGIKPAYGQVIRPLLCFSRKEIESYCQTNNLAFRIDSSNLESIYLRNKVRNQIIPLFQELNPSFNETMKQNMDHLQQVNQFFQASVDKIRKEMVVEQDDQLLLSLRHINEFLDKELILFELLQPYGFNGSVVKEIIRNIEDDVSGKQYYSSQYRLIKDRFNLIIVPIKKEDETLTYYIEAGQALIETPIKIKIAENIDASAYVIDKDSLAAQFDYDLLSFPLTLRKWNNGDMFRPLGMNNFKKLSDFFIDSKFSLKDKEDCWLLLSGDDIIWVVGHRTDDRYKITKKTQKVCKLVLQKD